MKATRSGFSMIELVFVIVILGVLAAVAVPRFAATRTDAQVATARSDIATALNAIPAKALADNIDSTESKPYDPNEQWGKGRPLNGWGEWISIVAGFDGNKWSYDNTIAIKSGLYTIAAGNAVAPVTMKSGKKATCGGVIGINAVADHGELVFTPQNLKSGSGSGATSFGSNEFCGILQQSYYVDANNAGNRVIPLMSSKTLVF